MSRLALNCSTSTLECDGNKVKINWWFWFQGPKQLPMSLVEHKFQVLPMSLVEHKLFNIKNISLENRIFEVCNDTFFLMYASY